jgi:hypothetical protein
MTNCISSLSTFIKHVKTTFRVWCLYRYLFHDREALRAHRDRLRRIVACLPRNSETATFLSSIGSMLLDAQFAVEDGNGILGNMELYRTKEQELEYWRALSLLSDGIYKLIDIFGKIVLAARYDCRAVLENMDDEEEIPGVLSETIRAVRTSYWARQDAKRI